MMLRSPALDGKPSVQLHPSSGTRTMATRLVINQSSNLNLYSACQDSCSEMILTVI